MFNHRLRLVVSLNLIDVDELVRRASATDRRCVSRSLRLSRRGLRLRQKLRTDRGCHGLILMTSVRVITQSSHVDISICIRIRIIPAIEAILALDLALSLSDLS